MRLKELEQGDVLFFFVTGIIIFGLCFVWYLAMPLWFKIILTSILGFSLYYQFMVWRRQSTTVTLGMDIEERMINELAYQVLKKGYTFKVDRVPLDEDDPHSDYKIKIDSNMPRWKRKIVKIKAMLILLLNPAWNYKEFEGEEDIWVD